MSHANRGSLDSSGDGNLPTVSVIVPVYNAAPYLRASLDSIVAQTYPNLEILVLDDGSTDASPEILGSYGDRIRLHRQPANLGQFANVWDGIERAEGETVCVFHADDIYDPVIVEREVSFLQAHPRVGAVFCLDRFMDSTGHEYGRLRLPDEVPAGRPLELGEVLRGLLLHGNHFLRTPGTMVRAEVYEAVEPFRQDDFGHAADLDMWLRIARHRPLAILPEHLFSYRHRPDSAAHSYARERREVDVFFRLLERHLDETGYEPSDEEEAAYRARRESDRLLVAAGDYIRGELDTMRQRLEAVKLSGLLGSGRVRRPRLLLLYGALQLLSRLPRIPRFAAAFRRRWYDVPGAPPEAGGRHA